MRLELAPELLARMEPYRETLKEILNVSQVEMAAGSGIKATAVAADGVKCERCWNYSTHVGEDSRWPTVCDRCASALEEVGFAPLVGQQP